MVPAIVALFLMVLVSIAGAAEPTFFGSEATYSAATQRASESLLRLTDMPAGFVLGYEDDCGTPREKSETEGIYEEREHLPPTPEEAFIKKTGSELCTAEYERLYRAAGTGATPALLISLAFTTPSAAAAAEGLAIGPGLLEYELGVGGFSAGTDPTIGEEARLFRTNRASAPRLANLPGTLVLWRQGAMIGGVFAVSMKTEVSDAAAMAYATRQQAYVLAPRPYLAAEAEDRATYLGNPNLTLPIYWLGETFKAKGRPPIYFDGVWGSKELVERIPGRQMSVEYSDGLTLDTWTRAGWAKFSKTATGRRQWSWRCTRSRPLQLPHGHAVIYAAYRKDEQPCPSGRPTRFSAHVFLPGVVIAIGEAFNPWSQGQGAGPHQSWRALEAVVRNLRLYKP